MYSFPVQLYSSCCISCGTERTKRGCLTSHTEQLLPRPVVVSASVQCQLGMSTVCVYVDPEMELRCYKVCHIYFALPAMTCVHGCL